MTTAETHSWVADKARGTSTEPTPNCPACDGPVSGFAATGPNKYHIQPCGCLLSFARVSDIAQETF